MPIKFTTTSTGGKKERKKKNLQVPWSAHTLTRTHAHTHVHRHTKGRRGWGTGARERRGTCLQNYRSRLSARGQSARGRRTGSAARPERHDGGRGSEPIFWRGSCNDAIPRPRVPAARPSPCLFFTFVLRRVDVWLPARLDSFLYFSLGDSCLLCVCPHARQARDADGRTGT